jgi:hypothetical protein
MVEVAQQAVGVLAARRRGDVSGAQTLLATFPDDSARAFGFLMVSELAMTLLEQSTGEPAAELCQDLSLSIAGTFTSGRPG